MEPNKEKKKRNFTVMVVTETEEGHIRQFHLGAGVIKGIAAVLAAVILFCAGYGVSKSMSLSNVSETNAALTAKVENLIQETKDLELENEELSNKVTLLSETVNDKVQKESEDAEKYIPTGFPLSGTAAILEEDQTAQGAEQAEEAGEPKEPIVNFAAVGGSAVVATGNGTVVSIQEDTVYGRMLTLDHGNGYISIYRVAAEPKVKEGDELTKGTMLFEISQEGAVLGYQIQKDNSLIDPLELIEISG